MCSSLCNERQAIFPRQKCVIQSESIVCIHSRKKMHTKFKLPETVFSFLQWNTKCTVRRWKYSRLSGQSCTMRVNSVWWMMEKNFKIYRNRSTVHTVYILTAPWTDSPISCQMIHVSYSMPPDSPVPYPRLTYTILWLTCVVPPCLPYGPKITHHCLAVRGEGPDEATSRTLLGWGARG